MRVPLLIKENTCLRSLSLTFFLLLSLQLNALAQKSDSTDKLEEPLFKPFIERYILDELKTLRENQADLKKQTIEKITAAELNSADRAMKYTTDTTNNIFYIITIAASILVVIGWRSLSDIKRRVEQITEDKINKATTDYEKRLTELEIDLKKRTNELMKTQEKLAVTNQIQSIWRRVSIEDKIEEKIHLYDQILELVPNNVEALTYKADGLLDIGEIRWANSLSNQAIEIDPEYYLAYWQRACSNAKLGNKSEALKDLEMSIELSDLTKTELINEPMFDEIKESSKFNKILSKLK
ncbi:tetratricopeptide repeat protein [Echinicola salinicaeni]|uniref:tetratricopeptide repeat protein n=1 Tax=Echinicola salinicaeni TaxID=2762757 RepID=UPI001645EF43|nr:tetratricopeptide repeat protein [Echinicola salinicaeni]